MNQFDNIVYVVYLGIDDELMQVDFGLIMMIFEIEGKLFWYGVQIILFCLGLYVVDSLWDVYCNGGILECYQVCMYLMICWWIMLDMGEYFQ